MATYLSSVLASTNSAANTFDTFNQLQAAASTEVYIRRIRVFYSGGSGGTAVGDNNVDCELVVQSALGSGGTAQTPVKLSPTMTASVSTASTKNGTTNFTVGTVTGTLTQPSFNERGFYEWTAIDPSERYSSGVAGTISLAIRNSAATRPLVSELEWDE